MGDLSLLSWLVKSIHVCASPPSPIVLKPTGVGVAHGSSVFSSHGLLPRYPSQRVSASEVRGVAVFGIVQEFVQQWAIPLAELNCLSQEENACYLSIIPERQAKIATWVRSAR